MLDIKKIQSLKWARPFRPFEIELDDGRVIAIVDPFTVGWAPEINTLMFPGRGDSTQKIDFRHVVDVRPRRRRKPRRKAS
jgi:hypothetical protein